MADLTADPNPNPLAKPVAQPVKPPDAPERIEADSGRPGPDNPNAGRGPVKPLERAERDVGETAETLDRSDTAVAERVRDDTVLAQGIPGPIGGPIDPFKGATAHAGPVEAKPRDEGGAGAPTGPRVVMLVGGPRDGYQTRVEPGVTTLTADSGGVRHEYRAGANLPANFATLMPPQNTPLIHFGYYGPDAEAVAALRAKYPSGEPPLKAGGKPPAVAVDAAK